MRSREILLVAAVILSIASTRCTSITGGDVETVVAYVLAYDAAVNPQLVRLSGSRLQDVVTKSARGDLQLNVGLTRDSASGRLYWIYRGQLASTEWTVVELDETLAELHVASSATIDGDTPRELEGPVVSLSPCRLVALNFALPSGVGAARGGIMLLGAPGLTLTGVVEGFLLLARQHPTPCGLLAVRVSEAGSRVYGWIYSVDARTGTAVDSFAIPPSARFTAAGPTSTSVYVAIGDELMLFDGATQEVLAATSLGFRGLLGSSGPIALDAQRGRVVVGDPGTYETGGGETVLVLGAYDLARLGAFSVRSAMPAGKTIKEVAVSSRGNEVLVLTYPPPFVVSGGRGVVVRLDPATGSLVTGSHDLLMTRNLVAR